MSVITLDRSWLKLYTHNAKVDGQNVKGPLPPKTEQFPWWRSRSDKNRDDCKFHTANSDADGNPLYYILQRDVPASTLIGVAQLPMLNNDGGRMPTASLCYPELESYDIHMTVR